jgi:hypothetical protein
MIERGRCNVVVVLFLTLSPLPHDVKVVRYIRQATGQTCAETRQVHSRDNGHDGRALKSLAFSFQLP